MALTKPKLSQNIDTDSAVFNDPVLVLHQGATLANADVGFLFNRANGLVSNAAVIWQESTKSFVHILTSSSGAPNANLTVSTYANVAVGNVLLIANAGIYVDGTLGTPGQVLASDGSKTYWAPPGGFTGGTVANPTVFQSNLVVSSTTDSTSATTGALVVLGGVGVAANVYANKLYTTSGVYWSGNGQAFTSTTIANTAEITANLSSGQDVGLNLTTTGVVAGNYGSATSIPTIVVDSKGRISSVTSNAVSTTITLAGGSGSGSVAGGGTLTVNGTADQITTSVTSSTITIAFAQDITTPGNVTVTGNLVVQGNTTTLNTETLTVEDLNITVANGAATAADADGAGLTVAGANARLLYKSTTDSWIFDRGVFASGNLVANSGTISSSVSTGALVVAGGVGVSGNIYADKFYTTQGIYWSGNGLAFSSGSTYANANVKSYLESLSNVNIGTGTGINQSGNAVAIGYSAGAQTQGSYSVAIGSIAGQYTQGSYAVALGYSAGNSQQQQAGVSVGTFAGEIKQGYESTALGPYSGQDNQAGYSVAVGAYSGQTSQGSYSVALGYNAGQTNQNDEAIAIGYAAGAGTQGNAAIAIGDRAGRFTQGNNSIAIGQLAGYLNQPANSIILNASGSTLNASTTGFFVNPVRTVQSSTGVLGYNSTSKEVYVTNEITSNIVLSSTTASTSTSTGALVVTGGVGIGGNLYITNTGDVSANIGTIRANLNTLDANVGTFQTFSNSNAATQATSINSFNANLGAFQTFSNSNAATQATSINSINANIGAFYTYANTKIGTNASSNLVVAATTATTSTTTGALVVAGGAGIAGNVYIGATANQSVLLRSYPEWAANSVRQTTTFVTSATAPSNPIAGDQWYDSSTDITYEYISDGDSQQWVDVSSPDTPTNFTASPTPPTDPILGDSWYDTGTDILFLRIYDGTSTVWVDIGSASANIPDALVSNTITVLQTITINSGNNPTAIVNAGTSGVGNIGSVSSGFNTIFAKATSAQYADLAEKYIPDSNYVPGTVVIFGGDQEITTTSSDHDPKVAGVISTNPAYIMNDAIDGLPVALTGRVPCRVLGPVTKGDLLVTSKLPGIAQRCIMERYTPGCVLGKSLENVESGEVKMIEIAVGRF